MNSRRLLFALFGVVFSIASPRVLASDVEVVKGGPVHEAFMTQEFGDIILEAVSEKPPMEVDEKIPPQSDEQAKWIAGYWAYSKERGDFLWVSGAWRRSPPGHRWIKGEWQRFPEGWVWLSGFWSSVSRPNLEYIDEPPPDEIDEKIPQSPGNDYFWIPGYWHYDASDEDYIWTTGKWESFDKNWVYVPAHYLWREDGYIFVPAYWDWPVDARGVAYASVAFDTSGSNAIVYEPVVILDPIYIMELYMPCYPYYSCLFHHHYFFHLDFWIGWGGAPPWWGWADWWCFSWFDQWALWWWWGHPGFPQPLWLDAALANEIGPPPQFILNLMKKVSPPPIITPNGVVGPDVLLDAIDEVTGDEKPILPADPNDVEDIQQEALPKKSSRPFLKPKGPKSPLLNGPPKPDFGPSRQDLSKPPRAVRPPAIPIIPQTRSRRPPIRQIKPPVRRHEPPVRMQPQEVQPPRYRPYEPRRPREPRRSYRPTPPRRPSQPRYPDYTPQRPNMPQARPPSHSRPERPQTRPPSSSEIPQTRPPTSTPRYEPRLPKMPQQQHIRPEYTPSVPRFQPQPRTNYQTPMQGSSPETKWPPIPKGNKNHGNFMNRPMPQQNPPGPSPHHPRGYWD